VLIFPKAFTRLHVEPNFSEATTVQILRATVIGMSNDEHERLKKFFGAGMRTNSQWRG